jgi:hypothetical protein
VAYTHIASFQRNLSFEVWLTHSDQWRLDRQKSRTRRSRWTMASADMGRANQNTIDRATRPSDRRPNAAHGARVARTAVVACGGCPIGSAGVHAVPLPITRRATSLR